MDRELLSVLQKYSVKSQGPSDFNFITTWGPAQNWSVPKEQLGNFWFKYSQYVLDRLIHDKPIGSSVCERAQEQMPIVVHLLFKFDTKPFETENKEYYGPDLVLELIHLFQETFDEYLDISSEKQLGCVVLENKVPFLDRDKNCTTLCLHFPFLKTEATVFGRTILDKVLTKIKDNGVVKRFTKQPLNDWPAIINPMSCLQPIPLYCARKDPTHLSMTVNGLYQVVTKAHVIANNCPTVRIDEFFNPGQHSVLGPEIKEFEKKPADFWLPLLLSINFTSVVTKQRVIVKPAEKKESKVRMDDPIGLFEELCPHLGAERILQRHYWLDIGRSIYNIYKGSAEGLKKWSLLSEQGDAFTEDDCDAVYYTLEGTMNTIKTIAWYVRADDPEWFKAWSLEKENKAMENALSLLDNDIAKCLYQFYWLQFVLKDEKYWYDFDPVDHNHKWVLRRGGLPIRKKMSGDLCDRFEQYRVIVAKQEHEKKDDRDLKELKLTNIGLIIKKLKTRGSKKNYLVEAEEYFGEIDFAYSFNTNSELLGVNNGVIEICGGKACFRPGKPEDYITKSTHIPLDLSLTEYTTSVIKLKKYLGQVFVDRELGHHFLKLAASKLRGRNTNKILEVWTGDKGNNSKSMMIKLHERTFGDYFIKFPTEILTNKKNLGGPNPELAQAEGVRIGCVQETAADRPMMPDTIKQLTGGDSFFARNCCQDGGKIEAMFKTILMCNKVARIDGADDAIYDRLRLVPFSSRWVKNPPESEEEQYRQRLFKLVGDFEHQISEMSRAFLWLIYNYYDIYVEEGLIDPPCVVQVTNNYWSETDPYNQYITEHLKKCTDAKGELNMSQCVTNSELFSGFSTWYKVNYPGVAPPNCTTVTTNFTQRLGNMKNRRYFGYTLESGSA